MQKLLKTFSGLATLGPHNSAMITNRRNSLPNGQGRIYMLGGFSPPLAFLPFPFQRGPGVSSPENFFEIRDACR